MIVYHGSTCIVSQPDLLHSKTELDFGRGFYLTTYCEQAKRWARRKAWRKQQTPFLNMYELDEDWSNLRLLHFDKVDKDWLDFVCECRRGSTTYQGYDIIRGPVADDDVFQSVNFYFRGIWSSEQALKALVFARPNDQIAIISQNALDSKLAFMSAVTLEMQP